MDSLSALAMALDSFAADRLGLWVERATPKQLQFHRSQAARRLLRAGNQTGKSAAGASEAWYHAVGEHPFREVPPAPSIGWVVVADLENHYPTICRKLRDCEPAQLLGRNTVYDSARGYRTRGRRLIELSNGSIIEFRSGRGEITALASATVDWCWYDEPPMESHYSESISRIAVRRLPSGKRAPAWMTLTPVGRPCGWIRTLVCGDEQAGIPPAEDWDEIVIRLTPEDCPHRTPESLKQQIASYLPSEVAQRANGDWEGPTHARLFSGFSPACLFEDDELPEREVSIGLSWDHGEDAGRELCLLYAYDESARCVWVLDECSSPGRTTIDQDAMQALEMLDRHGLSLASVDRLHGDTNSAGKGSNALASVNRLLEEALARALGIPVSRPPVRIAPARKGPGSVMMGARVVNNALLSGRLKVSPRCVHLIKGLSHWRGTKNSRDADLSHALDSLRYGTVDILDPRARGAHRLAVR